MSTFFVKSSNSFKQFSFLFILILQFNLLSAQEPTISSFSPVFASPGETVTITGTGFNNIFSLNFGGVPPASYTVLNSSTIKAVIGTGASGDITLNAMFGFAKISGFTFFPVPVPSISSFTPAKGEAGSEVTINGANFSVDESKNLVYFGVAKAVVTSATPTVLKVIVPPGATGGPITVTVNNMVATTNLLFTLTFSDGGFLLPSSFDANIMLSLGSYGDKLRTCDLDLDGKPDLIIPATVPSAISVFRNNSTPGNPSFATKVAFATTYRASSVSPGDLDGDGKPDLVTTTSAGGYSGISTFTNNSTPGQISFTNRKDYSVGLDEYSSPENSVIADLNLDGKPDVIVTSFNTISLFRNVTDNNGINLQLVKNITVLSNPKSFAISDLDGDSKPDIVVAQNNASQITILKNTSTLTEFSFVEVGTFPVGVGPTGIAIGDIDNDSRNDIVVANSSESTITVFQNNSTAGNISFHAGKQFEVGQGPNQVVFSDLDGDGWQDLAIGCDQAQSGAIAVLRNTSIQGTISFAPSFQHNSGGANPRSVAAADFDGDGIPDLAATNSLSNTIAVSRNRIKASHITSFSPIYGGRGTIVTIKGFNLTKVTAVSLGNEQAASFSIESDNIIKAVVGSGSTGDVKIIAEKGNGATPGFTFFSKPFIYDFEPSSGKPGSTVTIKGANFNSTPENNIVYFGSVKATVSAATANELTVIAPIGADHRPISITTGSLTAYSNRPFILTFPGGPAAFLPNSFEDKIDFTTDSPIKLETADLNMDGKPDLIGTDFYNNKLSIYPNTSSNGIISLGNKIEISINSAKNFKTGDFDGDGKPDLVVVNSQVSVYKNTSSGGNISFSTIPYTFTPPLSISSYTIGDIDNDGRPDIAALFWNSLVIFRNTTANGNISFSYHEIRPTFYTPRGIVTCDFNHDGKTDLAVASSSEDHILVFPNNGAIGSLSFGDTLSFKTGDGPSFGLTLADVDSDGMPDFAVNSVNSGGISVLRNLSATTFSFDNSAEFPTGITPYQIRVSDIDGDGKPDFAALNENNNNPQLVTLLKNQSGHSVSYQAKFDFAGGTACSDICIADMDGDGKPDIIASFIHNNAISIFRNRSNEALITPAGNSPVSGKVTSNISIDPSVQSYNGNAYVQRNYTITPANNSASATANITLYFTQEEFDNFNAHPDHGADLPRNSSDVPNISNLRIYKYSGYSASGLPGDFDGGSIEIDPADEQIIWNTSARWWEVTFPVTGFSRFFLSSTGFMHQAPAAPVLTADGSLSICDGDKTILRSSISAGIQWYKNGDVIANATNTTFEAKEQGNYTATVTVNSISSVPSNAISVVIKPVPAKPVITNNGTDLLSSATTDNQWYFDGAIIPGATNQTYKPTNSGNYSVVVTSNDCSSSESDKYTFVYTGVINIDNEQYIRLSPNPVDEFVQLTFNITGATSVQVQLFDMNGKVCGIYAKLKNGSRLYVNNLRKGIYFARIDLPKKKSYVIRLLKL